MLTPITFGGAEKVSLNFLRTVDRKQFDIKPILLVRPWEEQPYFARAIQHMGYSYDTVPVSLKQGGDHLRVPRVAYRLYSILKNGSFDLVHTHGYFADVCCLPAVKWIGVRSVSTCHGFVAGDRKLRFYNMLDTLALRLCNTIISVSEGIRDELIHSGIKKSRIEFIPNAVAKPLTKNELLSRRHDKRAAMGILDDEFVVGYSGRLSEEKGLCYLVEAILHLRNSDAVVRLLIVGDGPERQALELLVKDNGLDAAVFFAGFQEDIENWLPAFDAFALPSLTEGTPMALLEAMAVGLPVIATAVGGVPRVVIDMVNGMLVPPGNAKAISDGLKMVMDKPDLRYQIGAAGVETVAAKYNIESWCREIQNLYCGE